MGLGRRQNQDILENVVLGIKARLGITYGVSKMNYFKGSTLYSVRQVEVQALCLQCTLHRPVLLCKPQYFFTCKGDNTTYFPGLLKEITGDYVSNAMHVKSGT